MSENSREWPLDKATVEKLKLFTRFDSVLHGPEHWARVAYFGRKLSEACRLTERETLCVEVFSWTHDLQRKDDSLDPGHGARAAKALPDVLKSTGLFLTTVEIKAVQFAIHHHSDGMTADDAYCDGLLNLEGWTPERLQLMVGCCWNADRLDLLRLNIEPHPKKMSGTHWVHLLQTARHFHQKG